MKVLIDGDGCPVIAETERAAALYGLEVLIFCDTSHLISSRTSRVILVDQGRDAADWAIISAAKKGDLVITQDYGLASLVLARKAYGFHQNGWQYRDENIESLLMERYEVGKAAIPFHEIKKAIRFSLPGLISSFKGDERNVLLTLSRMWFTLVTEEITTKDVAAKWVILKLPERFPPLLTTAKEAYLGNLSDEWETVEKEAMALVEYMKKQIEELLRTE